MTDRFDSEAAARAAHVVVRELTDLADLDGVYHLFDEIWRPEPSNPPVTTELLRAMAKAGNYVAGAFDGTKMVGACVGFLGMTEKVVLHSHVAGVSGAVARRGVGFALKLHQRSWALHRGLTEIHWTFDPLVSRNAYFNIAKLGAAPAQYLPNFYGGMRDGINGSDESDRLLACWDLHSPITTADHPADAVIALDRSDDDSPVMGTMDGTHLLVAVPRDIEALRMSDPATAGRWRFAVRDVLGTLLAEGARVTGFDRSGRYRVTRKDAA
ncbi:GNAT family N-acetyltransferase [Actinosynnema sp. ALI-1.44]|uniref:GNAT family N-acetyltransferase n=1 Tax=Actinosynnema sp. ALI-1.44 TaxID=1933779 RepID=UPI00097C2636|nr:GNAT family N-acetyltransferase [Actinosynnema sp. ALI-1.44]ONI82978.1 GNAT family N-acetyltransferase [Actinosynnema sp. ALI-1.44]